MVSALFSQLNAARLWRWPVRIGGNRFRPPTLDRLVALLLLRIGLMGRGDLMLFRALIQPGMTVVDVGANQGVFTLACADLVGPTGTVIAFEPDPDMFAALRGNVADNGKRWVQLHRVALGSTEGQMHLRRATLNRGDNRLQAEPAQATGDMSDAKPGLNTLVPVTTLDRVLARHAVDLVKMDVQGWETEVLRGMTSLVSGLRPPWIHLEVCPYLLQRAGSGFEELAAFLRHHGYALHEGDLRQRPIEVDHIRRLRGALGYTNVLAVPRHAQTAASILTEPGPER